MLCILGRLKIRDPGPVNTICVRKHRMRGSHQPLGANTRRIVDIVTRVAYYL